MKEWNRPQLLSLGVENTFEDIEEIANNQAENHWCHAMNGGLGGKCDVVHNGNTGTHTSVNASHHHPATGTSIGFDKCCCPGS